MGDRFLGFFSGFPSRRFPGGVAGQLREVLTRRDSLVFISAWPAEHARNDEDSSGMHGMFEAIGMPFDQHYVIDDRMEPPRARRLIREASCVFLMGGHPGLQARLLREKGLDAAIRDASAAVLGVSAGAVNMARYALDTKESPIPYEGLNLADITIKPHFEPENQQVLSTLLQISMELPIYATQDDSAIFVSGDKITILGQVHCIHRRRLYPLPQGNLGARLPFL